MRRRVSRLPRRAVGALVATVCLAAGTGTGTGASAGAVAGRAAGAGAARAVQIEKVATTAARGLGEPAAARDATASAVTATRFDAAGARAAVWAERAGTTTWRQAGSVLPAGFGTSYDPAAAAAPGGPLLVVAGTAPSGQSCIANGSVAIANVDSKGRLGAARLVSDQRGTGSFDDRPMVAVGQHDTVWVAWSQGPNADACQDVGLGDRIEVAVSHDGGQTFGAPAAMPADGGHSAFGVRLAPLPGGVAVSWTETMASGDEAVLVSVLGTDGKPGQPQQVLTGGGPPLILPGASFYDFPAGDIVALPDGKLVVTAPFWVSGRSVLKLAVGVPGERWRTADLRPPAGADLLLPALGLLSSGDVRVLCAVHTRLGDHLGYDVADLSVAGQGVSVTSAGLAALTPAPAGPGLFEIGEELSLAHTSGGLLAAIVVAGKDGATLETVAFKAPVPAAPAGKAGTPASGTSGTPTSGTPAASTRSASGGTSTAQAANGGWFGSGTTAALVAAAVLFCSAVVLVAWLARRRRPRPGGHKRTTRLDR